MLLKDSVFDLAEQDAGNTFASMGQDHYKALAFSIRN